MFLLRMLVAQEKESKLSLDRTLAAIDKVTSELLDWLLISIWQVQNLMEVGNKLRAKLLIASGGEDTSPLEQEIRWGTLMEKFLTIFKNNSP